MSLLAASPWVKSESDARGTWTESFSFLYYGDNVNF